MRAKCWHNWPIGGQDHTWSISATTSGWRSTTSTFLFFLSAMSFWNIARKTGDLAMRKWTNQRRLLTQLTNSIPESMNWWQSKLLSPHLTWTSQNSLWRNKFSSFGFDQSEAVIKVMWSLWTNQRPVSPSHTHSQPISGQYIRVIRTLSQSEI